jgi:hypothetical protein
VACVYAADEDLPKMVLPGQKFDIGKINIAILTMLYILFYIKINTF